MVIAVIVSDLQKRNFLLPSKKAYDKIIDRLFEKFPYIGDPDSWKQSLINKMKQVRLPLDSPEVVAMKKKYGRPKQQNQKRERENHGEVVAVLQKKQRPCDVQTSSEDATDTRHHLAILKSEMSKLSPDLEIITKKMNITASYRNEKLYDPAITLSDILSEFPALRVGRILENEAQRAGIVKSGESFLKLSSSLPELIKFGKGRCKQFMKYHKKYVEDLDSATTQEQQAECSLLLALQLLPSLFREDEKLMLVESVEDIKDPTPVLTARMENTKYISTVLLCCESIKQM